MASLTCGDGGKQGLSLGARERVAGRGWQGDGVGRECEAKRGWQGDGVGRECEAKRGWQGDGNRERVAGRGWSEQARVLYSLPRAILPLVQVNPLFLNQPYQMLTHGSAS